MQTSKKWEMFELGSALALAITGFLVIDIQSLSYAFLFAASMMMAQYLARVLVNQHVELHHLSRTHAIPKKTRKKKRRR